MSIEAIRDPVLFSLFKARHSQKKPHTDAAVVRFDPASLVLRGGGTGAPDLDPGAGPSGIPSDRIMF